MGYSTWSNDSYTAYASATNYRSLSQAEVFTSRALPTGLDPKGFILRESRDSDANPMSTPIIFGLDVTGSMSVFCEAIAKTQLPELMTSIHEKKPVSDPHIMFMGIGDIQSYDRAPLQVSQFEADLRIVEQLREMYLEGGGGGNDSESYTLPWYVAAFRTATDVVQKRKQKGFLFTMGDECVPPALSSADLIKAFGPGQLPAAGTNAELLAKVSEMYHVFHIVVEEGSYYRRSPDSVRRGWDQLMGASVLYMQDHRDLSQIAILAMEAVNGKNIQNAINESGSAKDRLKHAFANVLSN